jgi:hypothetical protein
MTDFVGLSGVKSDLGAVLQVCYKNKFWSNMSVPLRRFCMFHRFCAFLDSRRGAPLRLILIALVGMIIVSWAGCSTKEDVIPTGGDGTLPDTVTYANVKPVFDGNCAVSGCHAGSSPAAGLNLGSLAGILAGSGNGPVVIAGNSTGSLLVVRTSATDDTRMPPPGRSPLSPTQINLIKKWIDDGLLP